ncbi:MAG: glycosyltransferase family 2 protein [Bacteroidales bacterium]|jgi:Predicted glycosyltransferases|nr:glycosyltransferase family 2 protein [Bacteroidales bacterium]
MKTPILSFITVNYNGLKDTIELIESIFDVVHSIPYEIIVIDNASRNNDAETIQKQFGNRVITIRSNKNLGFAGGNSLGLEQAQGKYLFFINNDTIIQEDHLVELLQTFDQSDKIGGLSPKIRFAYSPCHIQYAGFTDLSAITLRNKSIGFDEIDHGQYNTPTTTPFLHGAAMIIKRNVIERIGFMSDIFFLYYEEMDWCTQIRRTGYELRYEPCQTIYHKESRSTGKTSKMQIFYLYRNRLLYAWRNLQGINRYLSITYLLSLAALKNSIHFCIKGQLSLAITIYKAIFAFIVLPHKMK